MRNTVVAGFGTLSRMPEPLSRILLAVALLSGCTPSPQSTAGSASGEVVATTPARSAAPPASTAPPPPSTAAVDAAPPSPSTAAPAVLPAPRSGAPLPSIAEVRRIRLEREQGGPSVQRCGGREYDVELDLSANTWVRRLCHPDTKGPAGNEPLTRTTGKLLAPARAELERVYAQLRHEPARGCGKDGGTLRLIVTLRSGKTERWVDQNWGCVQPPPDAIEGLDDLRVAAMAAAHDQP